MGTTEELSVMGMAMEASTFKMCLALSGRSSVLARPWALFFRRKRIIR